MTIDRAEIGVEWDAARRTMVAPFQILSGTNRVTLLAHLEPPNDRVPHWQLGSESGGTILLATPDNERKPLIFNRVAICVRFDTDRRTCCWNAGGHQQRRHRVRRLRPSRLLRQRTAPCPWFCRHADAGIGGEIVVAGDGCPEVREWVLGHVGKGAVQRLDIGINAPVKTLVRRGPPIPEDGLSVSIVTASGVTFPSGLWTQCPCSTALICACASAAGRHRSRCRQATLDTPGGRKLTLSDMLFEVPDTVPKPSPARMRFRVEGPVPAVAEVLAMDRLAEFSGTAVDANTAKGTVNAAGVARPAAQARRSPRPKPATPSRLT